LFIFVSTLVSGASKTEGPLISVVPQKKEANLQNTIRLITNKKLQKRITGKELTLFPAMYYEKIEE
jgi:hypothetical protein